MPDGFAALLAFTSLVGERLAAGGRWLASRLLLMAGVLGAHAARAGRAGWRWTADSALPGTADGLRRGVPAAWVRLRRTPAWILHCLVIAAGLWLAAVSAWTALRATLGPETGAGVLSVTFPSLLAMLLAVAAVLVSLHKLAHSSRSATQALLLAAAVAALALG